MYNTDLFTVSYMCILQFWLHVAKVGVDATLSGNCVTSGGEQFCDDSGFESFLNFENKRENKLLFVFCVMKSVVQVS